MELHKIMQAVYIDDRSSGLDKSQVENINLILFNMKRRFEQASYQNTKKAPAVINTITNISNRITELTYKEYDSSIYASFVLDVRGSTEIKLWSLKEAKNFLSISFCGVNNYEFADEVLNGSLQVQNKDVVFKLDRPESSSFFVTILMEILDEDSFNGK